MHVGRESVENENEVEVEAAGAVSIVVLQEGREVGYYESGSDIDARCGGCGCGGGERKGGGREGREQVGSASGFLFQREIAVGQTSCRLPDRTDGGTGFVCLFVWLFIWLFGSGIVFYSGSGSGSGVVLVRTSAIW